MARRLIEMNARKREEKLAEDEEQLNQLLALQVILFLNINSRLIETYWYKCTLYFSGYVRRFK